MFLTELCLYIPLLNSQSDALGKWASFGREPKSTRNNSRPPTIPLFPSLNSNLTSDGQTMIIVEN